MKFVGVLLVLFMPCIAYGMDAQPRVLEKQSFSNLFDSLVAFVTSDPTISREALQKNAEQIGIAMQALHENRDELVQNVMDLKSVLEGRLRLRLIEFFIQSPMSKLRSVERVNLALAFIQDATENKDRINAVISLIATVVYKDTQAVYSDHIAQRLGQVCEKKVKEELLNKPYFVIMQRHSGVDLNNASLPDLLYYLYIYRLMERDNKNGTIIEDFFKRHLPSPHAGNEGQQPKKAKITQKQLEYINAAVREIKEIKEKYIAVGFPLQLPEKNRETLEKIVGGISNYLQNQSADPLTQGRSVIDHYAWLVQCDVTFEEHIKAFEVVNNGQSINVLLSEVGKDTSISRDSLKLKAQELGGLLQDPLIDLEELIECIMKTGDILEGKLRLRLVEFFLVSKKSKLTPVDRLKLAAIFLENTRERSERHVAVAAQLTELLYEHPFEFAPYAKEHDVERILRTNYKDEIKKNLLEQDVYKLIKTHCGIDFTYSDLSLLMYYRQVFDAFKKEIQDAGELEVIARCYKAAMDTDSYITREQWERAKLATDNILANKEKLQRLGITDLPLLGSLQSFEKLVGGLRNYLEKDDGLSPQSAGRLTLVSYKLTYASELMTRQNYDGYLELMKKRIKD